MIIQTNDPGIREIVNGLFDEYIVDAFASIDPVLNIAQYVARIGIVIVILSAFMNETRRADIFAYMKWIPLAVLFANYKSFAMAIFEFYSNIGLALQPNDLGWDLIHSKISSAQDINSEQLEGIDAIYWNGRINSSFYRN